MNFIAVPKEFKPTLTAPSYLLRKKLLYAIAKHCPLLKGKMLDFGCGSKPYKSLFTVDEYIGVDFNGDGHSHANEQIDFFYDGKTLPFENDSFDSVFSTEVFEHVFNLTDIIPEIRRVMKPGALILITCPFAISEHEQPNDYARYTSFAMKDMFSKNNFEVVDYEKIGTDFETIMQLWIIYVYTQILCKFDKLVIIRPIFDPIIVGLLNIFTICFSKILPKKKHLYMNNLIICRKK